jgi:hypothetical protein
VRRRARCMTLGVESPRVAARRTTLYGLHVCAVTGGLVALVVWLIFHDRSAALVAGGWWTGSGLLALLSHRLPALAFSRRSAVRGALLEGYASALLVLGGLLLRSGVEGPPAAPRAPTRHISQARWPHSIAPVPPALALEVGAIVTLAESVAVKGDLQHPHHERQRARCSTTRGMGVLVTVPEELGARVTEQLRLLVLLGLEVPWPLRSPEAAVIHHEVLVWHARVKQPP